MNIKCSTVSNLGKGIYSIFTFGWFMFLLLSFSHMSETGNMHMVTCACNIRVRDTALIS